MAFINYNKKEDEEKQIESLIRLGFLFCSLSIIIIIIIIVVVIRDTLQHAHTQRIRDFNEWMNGCLRVLNFELIIIDCSNCISQFIINYKADKKFVNKLRLFHRHWLSIFTTHCQHKHMCTFLKLIKF